MQPAKPQVVQRAHPADVTSVQAENYSSFWIWGGVRPQPVLARAKSLYILQGEVIEQGRQVRLVAQGMTVAQLRRGKVWLVYRTNTLHWTPAITQAVISRLKLWRLSGNPVIGLQIDFDAGTRYLQNYASFLQRLRDALPDHYQLGITGLLDWSSNGDIKIINQLKNIVDEVALQTYQGRKTIPDYAVYLKKLDRLTLPFKIGLIQHGKWQPVKEVESHPWFRGYIIFLQNER
ncbi:MAG: DUF3142 domain-containing protein [Candidatus Electrothrix sp. ATG2]|nr:DUF3142 domain-containing protein [Candidatus Electrothrix sp. ATG2]